jgi:ribosomal 50S subunit-recycling heat shock protein
LTDAAPSHDAARADVWLWRARFFKTRSLAAKFVDEGRIRLTRAGAESRIDKPSRTVKPGAWRAVWWRSGSSIAANGAAPPARRADSTRRWRLECDERLSAP